MERNQTQQFFTWRSAIMQSDLPAMTRLVLFVISFHMNEAGLGAFPSIKTIQKETALSRPATIKHMKLAEESGWLKIDSREHKNGACRSNIYSAIIPEGGLTSLTRGGKHDLLGVVNEVNPYNSSVITKLNKKLNKKADRVINHLNKTAEKNFKCSKSSREHIIARLKDGFTTKDCITVIDNKSQDEYFIDNPQHMNPVTLFRPTKFETYLNSKPKKPKKAPGNKRADQKYGHLTKIIMEGGVQYHKDDPNLPPNIKQQFEELATQ